MKRGNNEELVKRARGKMEAHITSAYKVAKNIEVMIDKLELNIKKGGGQAEYQRMVTYTTKMEEMRDVVTEKANELLGDLLDPTENAEERESVTKARDKLEETSDLIQGATDKWLDEVNRREAAAPEPVPAGRGAAEEDGRTIGGNSN